MDTSGATPVLSPYRYTKLRYRALFRIVDAVCSPFFSLASRSKRTWGDPRSILVVQLDHIGDAVITTALVERLKHRFPQTAIDVLASRSNQELFRAGTGVRRVHVSDRNWHARELGRQSWFPELFRLARSMRRERYDWSIDPRGDFLVALMLWLAGIPRRVGWKCGGGGFLLTDVAAWNPARHELESRRTLLEAIGIETNADSFLPVVQPSWEHVYAVREMLHSIAALQWPLVVIHVGAGTAAKRWPPERWASLVDQLAAEPGGSTILVGTAADRVRGQFIARSNVRAIDWTGRLKLMQLAALLREADLFIGCDSGPAHIAAAAHTPSIVLFSGTNQMECWKPVGRTVRALGHRVPCSPCHRKRCPVAGHPCMNGITTASVLAAARQMLDPNSEQSCTSERQDDKAMYDQPADFFDFNTSEQSDG